MTVHTLLIANRGEIALRVMRTARRMGIRTVAIFTDLDRQAPHVLAADQARRVPSYLDIDAVVAAGQAAEADAVHPGYGFLSERAAFARAVEAAGLTLVGPSATVMEAMGRKDAAREIAITAGISVVPRGEDAAFPVLVKAAAGGGGKGMRIVRAAADYDEAVAAARREALAAFGDDAILVEKYVERGRHIEVQIMADAHGTVLHLFERDCSAQRRHQKVLEEAPAPTITPQVRQKVTADAVALARHVGYQNAGTVEFLLDEATGEAYFLEMNTRLQVEHPVTELITGLDLVRAPAQGRSRRAAVPRPGRDHRRRPRHRGSGLRRGLLRRIPAPGGHCDHRPVAAERPSRSCAASRPGGQHLLRPDAGQDHRPRPGPGGGSPRTGRRAGPHGHPRPDHQHRVPPRPGREHGLRRRGDRHRLAGSAPARRTRSRSRSGLRRLGECSADRDTGGWSRNRPPVPGRRVAMRRTAGRDAHRARPSRRGRPTIAVGWTTSTYARSSCATTWPRSRSTAG